MSKANVIPLQAQPNNQPKKRTKKFRVSQEVELISEGAVMTVERSNEEFTETVWFDDTGTVCRETFLTETLKLHRNAKK